MVDHTRDSPQPQESVMNEVKELALTELGDVMDVTRGAWDGPLVDPNPVLSWRAEA
jgi:hypothetical protein